MYLVDSDWVIDALTNQPTALAALRRHAADGLSVSIVTFGEVFDGAYGFSDPQAHLAGFRRFLSGFVVLGLSDPIMELFAQHRSHLRRQGNLIPDLDLLIAATALHHSLTLMTRNRRHFQRIPSLRLYRTS
jgi:predicted nucleic acid-binding protein